MHSSVSQSVSQSVLLVRKKYCTWCTHTECCVYLVVYKYQLLNVQVQVQVLEHDTLAAVVRLKARTPASKLARYRAIELASQFAPAHLSDTFKRFLT